MKVLKDLSYGPYGERSLLDLYLPDAIRTAGSLVMCMHGGGWSGGSRDQLKWMCERLAARGTPAAAITYRFWPTWRNPAAMEDVHRALRWLRISAPRFGFRAERVAAVGSSAGAHLAACLALIPMLPETDPELSRFPSTVSCVVDICGPVDFPAMMRSASDHIVAGYMGMPFSPQTEGAYRAASPAYYVRPVPVPFLILHGTLDTGASSGQVPIAISDEFAAKLRAAGGEVTLVRLEGEDHGFSETGYETAWKAIAAFLDKHLVG